MNDEQLLTQKALNVFLEEGLPFSEDIVVKTLTGTLKPKDSCFEDWIQSLSDEEAIKLVEACEYCCFQEEDEDPEDEDFDLDVLKDLVYLIYASIELETEDYEIELEEEEINKRVLHLCTSATIELLRREGRVECLEKAKMSDLETGKYIDTDYIKKNKKKEKKKNGNKNGNSGRSKKPQSKRGKQGRKPKDS